MVHVRETRLALTGYAFQTQRLRQAIAAGLHFDHIVEFDVRDDDYAPMLSDFAPDLVIQYGSETTDEPRKTLNARYRLAPSLAPTVFAENAWLPQSAYIYLDERGLADQSTLHAMTFEQLGPVNDVALNASIEAYRQMALTADQPSEAEGFVLLCLQVPSDTVIQRASPFREMQQLIDTIENAFSGIPLVVRPHPFDPLEYQCRHGALHREGLVGDWIKRARLVLSCNSTTLIEAMALGVPAAAMGRGIFSGKGVCWEWDGNQNSIPDALNFTPDRERIDRFLWELARRQIPITNNVPDHTAHNPVLARIRKRWL